MQRDKLPLDNIKKTFHSSGYAQVANGNRIGATSNISFNQRQVIESSRRIVGGYEYSKLGALRNSLKDNLQEINNANNPNAPQKPSLQQFNSGDKPTNPKPQDYNPYS